MIFLLFFDTESKPDLLLDILIEFDSSDFDDNDYSSSLSFSSFSGTSIKVSLRAILLILSNSIMGSILFCDLLVPVIEPLGISSKEKSGIFLLYTFLSLPIF